MKWAGGIRGLLCSGLVAAATAAAFVFNFVWGCKKRVSGLLAPLSSPFRMCVRELELET